LVTASLPLTLCLSSPQLSFPPFPSFICFSGAADSLGDPVNPPLSPRVLRKVPFFPWTPDSLSLFWDSMWPAFETQQPKGKESLVRQFPLLGRFLLVFPLYSHVFSVRLPVFNFCRVDGDVNGRVPFFSPKPLFYFPPFFFFL